MSKHRTKAQKLKVAAKKQEQVIETPVLSANELAVKPINPSLTWAEQDSLPAPKSVPSLPPKSDFVWRFNPSLIYQDLFKTGLASSLIVGILLLIYYLSFSR